MQELLYSRHAAPVESSGERGGGGSTLARRAYHQSAMNLPAFTCHQGLPSCVNRDGPGGGTPTPPSINSLIEISKLSLNSPPLLCHRHESAPWLRLAGTTAGTLTPYCVGQCQQPLEAIPHTGSGGLFPRLHGENAGRLFLMDFV